MNDKLNELLTLYDNTLMTTGIPRVEQRYETPTSDRRLSHLRWLIDDLQHGPTSKAGEAIRLIQFGLIQGGLWAEGVFAPHVLDEHRKILLDSVLSTK